MASPLLIAATCLATNLSCATTAPPDGLPKGKAEPRRPAVTACGGLGSDYVWVPESDTCIKVGGYMRVDGSVNVGR